MKQESHVRKLIRKFGTLGMRFVAAIMLVNFGGVIVLMIVVIGLPFTLTTLAIYISLL